MSGALTDFPVTVDWLTAWEQTSVSIGTTWGTTLNPVNIAIKNPDSTGYNMMMNMSVKQQVKDGQTTLWWGYSSQVNYKTALATQGIM